jgi:hypothetical protein
MRSYGFTHCNPETARPARTHVTRCSRADQLVARGRESSFDHIDALRCGEIDAATAEEMA